MKELVKEEVAKEICEGHFNCIMTAFEEQQDRFPITLLIVDFITKLREGNRFYDLGSVFNSDFINEIYIEAERFISK